MLRQELQNYIDFGMPNSWEEIELWPDEKIALMDKITREVSLIEPLTNEEALTLAQYMCKDDLESTGTGLTDAIMTAPFWPTSEIFYVNNFSDPLMELKGMAFSFYKLRYYFTSQANVTLSFDIADKNTSLLNLQPDLNELDLQMLLATFYDTFYEDNDISTMNHVGDIIQNYFDEYPINKIGIPLESSMYKTLTTVFRVKPNF